MVADWAPPLLVLGLTPGDAGRVSRRGEDARSPSSTRPRFALPFWLAVWYGVHLPVFYDFALRHPWLLNVEHALLILAGLLFWWPVFATEPQRLSTAVQPRLPRGRLRRLGLPLARADLLLERVLRLLRSGAAPLGPLGGEGPEPRRDPDEREQMLVFFVALSYFLLRLLSEEEESQRALEG